jgi:hypothetical protein
MKFNYLFNFLFLMSLCFASTSCTVGKKNTEITGPVVYIDNGTLRIGFLHEVGGRTVLVQYKGGSNILKSDTTLWYESATDRMVISPESGFRPYNGHIVWLGPQTGWWAQQVVNPDRKEKQANWPPDPYLTFAPYAIDSLWSEGIRLTSPNSPVSGLVLTKETRFTGPDQIRFEVQAQNTRDSAVSWDLWLNTRLEGEVNMYVPVTGPDDVRVDSWPNEKTIPMPWRIEEGFFTFDTQLAPEGKQMISKAFIYPSNNYMVAFANNCAFIIRFEMHPRESIHPEQALVEIYNQMSNKQGDNLLEMEYHGPFTRLEPGEQFSTWETWQVLEYTGENTRAAHIAFLREHVK